MPPYCSRHCKHFVIFGNSETFTVYSYFSADSFYDWRWIFVALYLVVAAVNIACIVEYAWYFQNKRLPSAMKKNVLGLTLNALGATFMACYFANIHAIASGGYNGASLFFQYLFLFGAIALGVVQMALIVGTWLSVAIISSSKQKDWKRLSNWVTIGITVVFVCLTIFFTIYCMFNDSAGRFMFILTGAFIFAMCVTIVVSGLFVLRQMAKTPSASMADRSKRLRRMSIQLIALSVVSTCTGKSLDIFGSLLSNHPISRRPGDPYFPTNFSVHVFLDLLRLGCYSARRDTIGIHVDAHVVFPLFRFQEEGVRGSQYVANFKHYAQV